MKLIFAVLILASVAFAHMETEKSLEQVLSYIMSKQDVDSIDRIDCNKVSDAEFEELGDAMMERMAGNHELHEQMDEMMGGEGSESLRQMHIFMGMNWLSCSDSAGMGMERGMMMPMMMRMMGNTYPAFYSGFDTLLTIAIIGWILLVLAVAYIFYLRSKMKRHKR